MFANHTMEAVGGNTTYGLGFKGNWPYSSNYSVPADTLFDDEARATLDYLTGTLGIKHAARWHNEPRSQAEWDTWGYFLHGGQPEPAATRAPATTLTAPHASRANPGPQSP
jgi:hypothetical protein